LGVRSPSQTGAAVAPAAPPTPPAPPCPPAPASSPMDKGKTVPPTHPAAETSSNQEAHQASRGEGASEVTTARP
jgi:hypothetical protein